MDSKDNSIQDQSINELSNRVATLENKVSKLESIDSKMDKLAENSEKIVKNQEKILQQQRDQQALQIFQSQVYSPTGFFAHELTSYLIGHLNKYQTTNFRRWLSVKGGKVVELNIAQYVNSKMSMMQWYDTKLESIDEKRYHFSSKSAFPFEINTGVPFVGKITVTKVLLDMSGEVNTETHETTNMKCRCCADETTNQCS